METVILETQFIKFESVEKPTLHFARLDLGGAAIASAGGRLAEEARPIVDADEETVIANFDVITLSAEPRPEHSLNLDFMLRDAWRLEYFGNRPASTNYKK